LGSASILAVNWGEGMVVVDRYKDVRARIRALAEGENDAIALMATMVCELYHADDRFDWVGFYRNVGNETLKIGPYQGGHGCLVIPFSRGVCGAFARTGKVQLVPDVDGQKIEIMTSSSGHLEFHCLLWKVEKQFKVNKLSKEHCCSAVTLQKGKNMLPAASRAARKR